MNKGFVTLGALFVLTTTTYLASPNPVHAGTLTDCASIQVTNADAAQQKPKYGDILIIYGSGCSAGAEGLPVAMDFIRASDGQAEYSTSGSSLPTITGGEFEEYIYTDPNLDPPTGTFKDYKVRLLILPGNTNEIELRIFPKSVSPTPPGTSCTQVSAHACLTNFYQEALTITRSGNSYELNISNIPLGSGDSYYCLQIDNTQTGQVFSDDIYIEADGNSRTPGPTFTLPPGNYAANLYARNAVGGLELCSSAPTLFTTLPTITPTPPVTPVPSDSCPQGETYVATLNQCLSFGPFVTTAMNWAIMLAALLALFRLTIGGIQYIFSRGDPAKMEDAQSTLTSAIFGLILVFIAWLIIQFLGESAPSWWNLDFFDMKIL